MVEPRLTGSLERIAQRTDLADADDCGNGEVTCQSIRFNKIALSRSNVSGFTRGVTIKNCSRSQYVGYNGLTNQTSSLLNVNVLSNANLTNALDTSESTEEQRAGYFLDQCSLVENGNRQNKNFIRSYRFVLIICYYFNQIFKHCQ